MVENHDHDGNNSWKISGKNLVNAPQTTITPVSGTADGTYSANEQTLINDLTTAVNSLISKLETLKLLQ